MTDTRERPEGTLSVKLWVLIVVLLVAALLILPSNSRTGGRAGIRTQALNNIRNVSLAAFQYSIDHGQLPPAQTVDSEGHPLHSWRTLLLPYLDEQALYDSLNLTKPWDDPVNQHAWDRMPEVYQAPGHDLGVGMTAICAPVGSDHCFQRTIGRNRSDFSCPALQIIMLVQVSEKTAVHWMEPKDTAVEYLHAREESGSPFYDEVILMAFADGSVRVISMDVDDEILESMLSISDCVNDADF